jgi:hypothetical protein
MKVVSLSAHTPATFTLLPRKYSWYSFLFEAESAEVSANDTIGIEPATLRLVELVISL